jgi:hypothetical protein
MIMKRASVFLLAWSVFGAGGIAVANYHHRGDCEGSVCAIRARSTTRSHQRYMFSESLWCAMSRDTE